MFCLKNVFPNVGFADSYLSEGDVVRVQFTVAYGSDIGGGFAMGSGDSAGYFDMANKDALTRRVAAINAEIEANPYYLEQNCLTKAYDAAMDVLTTLYVSQADVDAALADLPDPPVGHQLTAVEKVPATCETAGVEAYWKCSVCGKLFSDAEGKTETTLEKLAIPATGHAYGEPVWKWNDDFTASATFTCGNDATHVKNVTAEVTSAVTTPAACETTGVRTYTAKVTFEGKEYTDTKTEVIPATGHAYGAPVWKWTDDFKATATFTCTNDATHVENVTAEVTSAVTTEATCKADGVRTYTAKVTFEGKEYTSSKTEVIPATGHAYGEPVWKWNDDFTASATFTCGNDATHVKNVTAEVTSAVTTPAACEADGVRTYTAKVTFEDKEYTDTKTEVIPATSHDTELVGAKDVTCTEDGYTGDEVCKVCGVTVKQGEVMPALGHDYKDGKCSRCGAEEPTTPVEPGKPATGDSSTLVLWLALLAVSGMAVTVIPSRKKRSR